MADKYDEGPVYNEAEGLSSSRRNSVPDIDTRDVKFARKFLHPEQIEALREFLDHASADEIAVIRKLYGETPEVLRAIGLEV